MTLPSKWWTPRFAGALFCSGAGPLALRTPFGVCSNGGMSAQVSMGSAYEPSTGASVMSGGLHQPSPARSVCIQSCMAWVEQVSTSFTMRRNLGSTSMSSLQMSLSPPTEMPRTTQSKSVPMLIE